MALCATASADMWVKIVVGRDAKIGLKRVSDMALPSQGNGRLINTLSASGQLGPGSSFSGGKQGGHRDHTLVRIRRMREMLIDAEGVLNRPQQRVVIVGRRVVDMTRTMVGDHHRDDVAAAEIRGTVRVISAASLRTRLALLLVVLVEGHDDRDIARFESTPPNA